MIRAEWLKKVNPEALKVKCPLCGIPAGKMCLLVNPRYTKGGNWRTEALGPHFERLAAARVGKENRHQTKRPSYETRLRVVLGKGADDTPAPGKKY